MSYVEVDSSILNLKGNDSQKIVFTMSHQIYFKFRIVISNHFLIMSYTFFLVAIEFNFGILVNFNQK